MLDRARQPFGAAHANHLRRLHDLARRHRHFVDIVAEKSSVCRFAGSDATMRRTLGQNPMSSMRSASSSTSTSSAVEPGGVGAHVVEQASRRRHDDVGRAAQAALLRSRFDAAVNGDARQIRVIGESLELVFDLHGKLAGRRQNQHARARPVAPRLEQALHQREEECERLASSRLRAGDEVDAVERRRETPRSGWASSSRTRGRSTRARASMSRPSDVNATGDAS